MAIQLRTLKTYVRDQVNRTTGRLSRPIRIAKGYRAYDARRKQAAAIPLSECYDVATLSRDGYLPIAPDRALLDERRA